MAEAGPSGTQDLQTPHQQRRQAAASPGPHSAQPAQTYDPQAYYEALRSTAPSTFARTAAAYAASPTLGPLRNPNLVDCILCDHAAVLTLLTHFFQAAEAKASNIMSMIVGAIALELRLHSQAEMQVLYPILAQRLGAEGAALAQRSLAEHQMLEQSIADMLKLRNSPGDALIMRMKQTQTEFMTHQGEEESLVLPRVVAVCSEEELAAMAVAFRTVKQTAPLMPQTAEVQAMNVASEQAAEPVRLAVSQQ